MKSLFIGLGSIGQRHLQNLKEIDESMELYALRHAGSSNKNNVIKNGKCTEVKSLADYYGIKVVETLEDAKDIKPDIVFVTNPSSCHVKSAMDFAKIGSHLFIEKPLCDSLEGLDELEKMVCDKKLVTMVGYQTRFNPMIDKLLKTVVKKNLDSVISASFEWNTFLPSHHKYENYSKGYAARKDLGGGVALGLIHEIDLIYHVFGMPDKLLAVGGKLSDLKMNADDTLMCIMKYKVDCGFYEKSVPVYLNLSYAQTKETRNFRIQFVENTLLVDMDKNHYILFGKNDEVVFQYKGDFERNGLFVKELTYFLDCVKTKKDTSINVSEGRKSLELALKIKESMKNEKWVGW